MKVIYILSSNTKYGGANKSFLNMLNGLLHYGIKPLVILPEEGGICSTFDELNIKYKIFSFRMSSYPKVSKDTYIKDLILFFPRLIRNSILNFLAEKNLYKIAKNFQTEIIHTNVGPIQIGYNVAKKLNIKHIWHIREFQTLDFNIKPLFSMNSFKSKLKSSNNRCIAITQCIFDYFDLDKSKDTVIYNGVLHKKDIRYSVKKQNYFLFAGRLDPNKGIVNLIQTYANFKMNSNSDIKLYIAGDTSNVSYNNHLHHLVKELKLDSDILFLGMRDDIYDLMYNAYALIVPSLNEAFGRITVEAIFNGCLVIGFDSKGTAEIIHSIGGGMLYKSESELLDLLIDINKNGYEHYYSVTLRAQSKLNNFDINNNVDAIYSFYKKT